MPHENERAGVSTSLKRLVESPEAMALRARVRRAPARANRLTITPIDLPRPDTAELPQYIIAIDGSQGAVAIEDGFPGAEIGVVTIASVTIDLHRLRDVRENGMPNPRKFRGLHSSDSLEMLLPSTNMILDGYPDARSSYRAEFFSRLENTRQYSNGETLLDTYEALLALGANTERLTCPLVDLCAQPVERYEHAPGSFPCDCGQQRCYSTDALRIHEAFMDGGSNQTVITESRGVIEHLALINTLRYFESQGAWALLCKFAFVMDGPLAISGHPAWLAMSIKRELRRLSNLCETATGRVPVIFGIEKTGMFQDHLIMLDRPSTLERGEGTPDPRRVRPRGHLTPGHVLLLNDGYVKQNIIYKHEVGPGPFKPYGSTSHYGRKALYKTTNGALITVMPAFLHEGDDHTTTPADPVQFPNLPTILSLLDALVSNTYLNATIPLVVAHAEAAIPARANESILKQFIETHMMPGVATGGE